MSDELKKTIFSSPAALPKDPTQEKHAATKKYVDDRDNLKLSKSGDTMEGPLILQGPPAAPNEAATKEYVDALDNLTAEDIPVTPHGNVDATNVQDAIEQLEDNKVERSGDTMTGSLLLSSASPALDLEAVPKVWAEKLGSRQFFFLSDVWVWNESTSRYEIEINHGLDRRPNVTTYFENGVEFMGDIKYNTVGVNGLTIQLRTNPAVHVLLT